MQKVTCAIIEKGERILTAKRSSSMHPPLKWEFPGGKLKDNESEEECILREIKEELNLKIEIIERLDSSNFDYGIKKIELIPFRCKYLSGEIILHEHAEALWIHPKEVLNYDLAEADIPILKNYLNLL